MPSRSIDLSDHFDRFIEDSVASGRYGDASEIVREGLRLVEERDCGDKDRVERLRTLVQPAIDQIDRGEGSEFESVDELCAFIDRIWEEDSAKLQAEPKLA